MALWTPAEISTALWLDASDSATLFDATSGGSLPADGSTVARWEDKSGNARHATQSTAGSRPTRKTAIKNSLDVIRLDGGDCLQGATPPIASTATALTIVTVAKTSLTATIQRVMTVSSESAGNNIAQFFHRYNSTNKMQTFGRGSGAESYSVDSTTTATGAFSLLTSRFNDVAGRVESSVNSETFTASSKGSAFIAGTFTRYEIGAITDSVSTAQFLTGDFCETIAYAGTDTATIQLLQGYVAWKWGINSSLPVDHPYYDAAPTTGIARRKINDGLFNRGLFNAGLLR